MAITIDELTDGQAALVLKIALRFGDDVATLFMENAKNNNRWWDVDGAFTWSETPQGHTFWSGIYDVSRSEGWYD